MPRASAVCNVPGCPAIAVPGGGKCQAHAASDQRRYNLARPTPAEQGYDASWRKLRAAYLKRFPFCAECGSYASVVDHIMPKARGGTDDPANLQALCARCHGRKSAKYDGRWG